ncbi:HEPN domain-containing protein [Anabaena lutea]|uniref:HEPN domain-containing protein n=1 Tax=Anabaena lutea FACHB-196 TaxID=2692881 RepID=A0ABR8FI22_9NOST|nr:HEPN domain-containing protein [Anabaena lutea]MBD2568867.1 HEPN domain-containing protein [Anabaena lutea FACHB-196]
MKFDWLSYLEVAQTLYNEVISTSNQANSASINEAKIRSCISRAYYSSFCLVRNYLRDVEGYSELINLKHDVHNHIINKILLISQDTNFINLGKDLRSLRNLRNKVDYEDEIPFHSLSANAKKALKYAEKIKKLLEKLKK